MNKKKLYLIVGGAVLAIALLVVVVGYGGNQVAAPDADVANPGVDDAVDDTLSSGDETGSDDGVADETIADGSADEELDENGSIIVKIPDDVKDGDVLNDGSIYFDELNIKNKDDAKDLLDKYKPNGETLYFTTTEYTGSIGSEHDGVIVIKKTENTTEVVMMFDNGMVNTDTKKYEDGQLVYMLSSGTEVDFYEEFYYDGNITTGNIRDKETDKIIETSIYETVTDGNGSYRLMIMCERSGYKQEFTYADKANKILASMTVTESNGVTYTYVMDGNGNGVDNVVTMTLTINGSTKTYTKGNFPFANGYVSPPGFLQ